MPYSVLDICIRREGGEPWGFKLVGGQDVGKVLRVSKVVGINTPAHMCGLQAGDVLVSVQDKVMDRMTHNEVVNIIKGVKGNELKMKFERGDHIIPNIGESFPIEAEEERRRITEKEEHEYYEEAAMKGPGSRLTKNFFTVIGKMKVTTPKYNCPVDMYSENTMDEMASGNSGLDPEKLDPRGPAYDKYKKSKKFDPDRSSVLMVINEQLGRY